MKLIIYRRDIKQPYDRNRLEKLVELTIKCIILLAIPLVYSVIFSWIWYCQLCGRGIYFNGNMEAIITCAWIPTFAVLYALVTSKVLDTVWNEYKAMRSAIKTGTRGIVDFVRLRDERVSPLIYAVIYVLSVAVLSAFAVIKYPSALGGFCTVSSTSYLFVLIICIIKEIDNPCGGLWFIRRIPERWLGIDANKFRIELGKLTPEQQQQADALEKIIDECQIK